VATREQHERLHGGDVLGGEDLQGALARLDHPNIVRVFNAGEDKADAVRAAGELGISYALALDPDLIMYDEPFAGLDPISMGVAANLIRDLNHALGVTSIVVSHDVDETFLNGERIGGMGSFPPEYRTAWDKARRYRIPASLVRGDGSDVLAVRVFDGGGNGGDPPESNEIMATIATMTNSVVADLKMIPNQPLKFADEKDERR